MKHKSQTLLPQSEVILFIAGFYIRIIFEPFEFLYGQQQFMKDFLTMYAGFIIKGPIPKTDYLLRIIHAKNLITLFRKKENLEFILYVKNMKENRCTTFHHISSSQLQTLFRKILLALLAKHDGFLLHTSAVKINRLAYLFLGKPYAGKSTSMKLLKSSYPPLADDTGFIRKINNDYLFFQTPFVEKEHWIKKGWRGLALGKLCFLRKSKSFHLKKIADKHDVLHLLMRQFFTEQEHAKKQTDYLFDFVKGFDEFYILSFAKDKRKFIEFMTTHAI
ncbi:hypothetical protein A2334_06005 [Candidatus Roizmanbacteria bacterium RIFOXYB2_FULL_38_10]|uniref:Uncharacterized protein n=1 Tax=Candidatus Roizmanbacteria bacterium RIFOXYD1_FULL_38_12 TaxID=1802093 RepID=A0A1F7L1W7_9BACT|nr:MAG: hypothetical protein A3K47_05005 [Candidatus Roizmanbacteria bacterium RIFOXYA2_FULL_38_14]OGK64108.1 MAG: hypothetical protein A3K27_05005 [Candidatus Roizmanbacteria bacterium RIFOXYA1_FULL_37_12]OGK65954.1 MAG: hypothetical protein A3K38_05005 [Candidatus Roizmanbacteria bacterium RIFOXYB1_FULL_40_23]OGK68402.1 MAG: hypothetical protein A2334_06005 [Candidatus Roizmanbacteria bacterium RIFOXYB2_FULL_38_10]OGK70359.1 MAG: hypothetical protein A3K21_05010 [Candidatus Roizmanbacteria ba